LRISLFVLNRSVAIAVCFLLLGVSSFPALSQSQNMPAASSLSKDDAIQQTIHDYILAHPEVIIESLQLAKLKQQERVAEIIRSKIVSFRKDLLEDPDAAILGNPNGDVSLVEFFDYRCPYCRQVEPSIQTLIKDDPNVRLVQKQFPILGPASVFAAQVALAAKKQGKHAEFHRALMAERGTITEGVVLQVAQSVGLDMERLKVDIKSPEVESEIQRGTAIAKSLGLTGTPGFIVGTELVPGATDLETLKSMIDDARHNVN
jgi:protein-disulfide isomerase